MPAIITIKATKIGAFVSPPNARPRNPEVGFFHRFGMAVIFLSDLKLVIMTSLYRGSQFRVLITFSNDSFFGLRSIRRHIRMRADF